MMLAMAAPTATGAGSDQVLTMVHPIPGFPEVTSYRLVAIDAYLSRLESVEDPTLRFLVVPAAQFRPAYAPIVGDEVVADLRIEAADDVLVLLIVHAAETLQRTTVNLRAPLLVNTVNRLAAQVILDDPDLELAAPLVP
jgi:flagellar assembly factor FliW